MFSRCASRPSAHAAAIARQGARRKDTPDPASAVNPGLIRKLESAFAADFSRVRISSDASAAEVTARNDAGAVTLGDSIALSPLLNFRTDRERLRALSHEFAHVQQQRNGKHQAGPHASERAIEVEAEAAARHVVEGGTPPPVRESWPAGMPARGRFGCGSPRVGRSGESAAPAACSGTGSCATGTACAVPDRGGNGASTSWQLVLHIDIEAPTSQVGINTPGHAWIELTESNGTAYTYGFYPGGMVNPFTERAAPCMRHPDRAHEPCRDRSLTFPVSQQQYQRALDQAIYYCQHPSDYNIRTHNCTSFAVDVLGYAGVRVPNPRGPVGPSRFVCDSPNVLLDEINRQQ
jgi:Domain of unknown function (DUF4157)